MSELRSLVIVLGDQLDPDAAAFDGFDSCLDAVWMAEVAEESTHVWSSKPRTVMFLAAMRHFALALQAAGRTLHYTRLDADDNSGSLAGAVAGRYRAPSAGPPGDDHAGRLARAAGDRGASPKPTACRWNIREDRHFFTRIASLPRMPQAANRCAWSISIASNASATAC